MTLVQEVLQAIIREHAGKLTKAEFYQLAKPLLVKHKRQDMNYGSWVSEDTSRALQIIRRDANNSNGESLVVTAVGRRLSGFTDEKINRMYEAKHLRDHRKFSAQFKNDTGETIDHYLTRKLAKDD
jgi:hypothetical protein